MHFMHKIKLKIMLQKGCIMENLSKELQEIVGKENLLKNEPMNKHTSIKIGRNSRLFYNN